MTKSQGFNAPKDFLVTAPFYSVHRRLIWVTMVLVHLQTSAVLHGLMVRLVILAHLNSILTTRMPSGKFSYPAFYDSRLIKQQIIFD